MHMLISVVNEVKAVPLPSNVPSFCRKLLRNPTLCDQCLKPTRHFPQQAPGSQDVHCQYKGSSGSSRTLRLEAAVRSVDVTVLVMLSATSRRCD
jgi:hypothetical protein